MAVDHNNPQSRNEEILIATIDGNEYNKAPQSRMEELLLELKETIEEGGGGGGTSDYESLSNQPQVNGETLIGDKTGAELGLVDAEEGKGLSTNDYDDNEKAAVAAATSAISAMKDGTDLDSFGDVEVALLDKADISDLGTAAAKDSTNAVTAGSTDLVESGAVKDAIDVAVAAAYHHAGTKTVAQLTHDLLIASNEGNVYNITDSGTTTSDFIEGIGKTIDEGSNVGICKVGNTYMFDLLSGFVDTTNLVQKSQTAGLLKNDGTVNDEIEGDISTLKSGLTNLDNEVNGDAVIYPYADVITVEDAVPANLADCSVKVEPVQDLHGYDKPWVGGAGKNKLPFTATEVKSANSGATWTGNKTTINGVEYEILEDDAGNTIGIKANGTATTNSSLRLKYNFDFEDGVDYILTGCPSGGSDSTYRIAYSNNVNFAYTDFGSGVTIRHFDSTQYPSTILSIAVFEGTAVNNIIFTPMIRLATETDATFAPYTNICPISGHTEAVVTRTGKNLFDRYGDGYVENKYLNYKTGKYTNNNNWSVSGYINNCSGKNITISGMDMDSLGTQTYDICFYDKDKNFIDGITTKQTTVSIPVDAVYIRFDYRKVDVETIQLELGSTATPYEPYAGQQYTLALGDTIYGGTVDFDSGVMTVDRAYAEFEGDALESWSVNTNDRMFIALSGAKSGGWDEQRAKSVSNEFDYNTGIYDTDLTGYYIANANLFVRKSGITTVEDFKTFLASNPLQVCYELATPTTIQLTPQQIQLLQGTNTLYASTGDISVSVNGVSGAIGAVQEQVNELAGEVEEIDARLDTVEANFANYCISKYLSLVDTSNGITVQYTYGNQVFMIVGKSYKNGVDNPFCFAVNINRGVAESREVYAKDLYGNYDPVSATIIAGSFSIPLGSWACAFILSSHEFDARFTTSG